MFSDQGVGASDFRPDIQNVSRARKFAAEHAASVGTANTADVVELLVSELVTNAILHAGTEVTLKLSYDEGVLRVEVRDTLPGMGVRRGHYGTAATIGRGLELIEVLATEWGVEAGTRGKTVWFTLRMEE